MAGVAPRSPMETETLLRETSVWLECVHQEDVSVELLIHFARWLDADPRHRAAFESIEKLCLGVTRVGDSHWPSAEELRFDTELAVAVGKASSAE